MNPAFLNYLQQQQVGQPQQTEMINQPQAPYNPFDEGIRRAIESARTSLGMTDKQQEKALRRSALTFAANMGQQPKQRGFLNNFGAAARSLAPAIINYDDTEEAYTNQNNAMANQILAYQRAEQERQAKEEEMLWRRQMQEKQLNESIRQHDLLNNFRQESLKDKKSQAPISGQLQEGKYVPFASKTERTAYAKKLMGANYIIDHASKILKEYQDFENLTKDNAINPLSPYGIGATANTVNDMFGYFSGNEAQQKQTTARKALEADTGRFTKEFEKALKGGILTKNMIEAFRSEGLLPDRSDPPMVFKAKLQGLLEEAKRTKQSAEKSLSLNAHVGFENDEPLPQEQSNIDNQLTGQHVWIRNPETGVRAEIDLKDLQQVLDKGWVEDN
jgi:predicted transposase YbfD/YdcC